MTKRSIRAASLACAFAVLAGAAAATQTQTRFEFDSTPGRLSKQVVPSHYALTLDLDPARDDFKGQVSISVKLRQAMPSIELHAFQLDALRATLVSGGKVRALRVTPQAASQTWQLTPSDGAPVVAGDHRIEIAYSGRVNAYGEGLFRAPYEAGGKPQRMLATQLEATSARTVFPSFDEPAFRAAIELTVRAPKEFSVLSNMPEGRSRVEGSTLVHPFPATLAMPTYLFSVAVGHFDVLAGATAGVPLRIITAPGKRDEARFALAATKQLLPYYNQYFGVPYALPKLDQLAVPSVRQGAMEDWGLISYAEDDILVDAKRSTERTRRRAYETLAHEIAHQWFGNLVTAASWEEIWLNEAFATWLQSKATDRFNPAWKIRLEDRQPIDRAMLLDSGAATRAIRSGPVRETSVADVFDPITYAKGGSVLTMLEQWMGPEAFRNGLVAYMKSQRLSNATAGDLWHHIGRASGKDVGAVAASWTDQQGFPLVQVQEACESGHAKVTLAQTRFVTTAPEAAGQVWKIPVRMARGATASTLLFDAPQATIDLGACSTEPLIVNAGGMGFYRVAYQPSAMRALTDRFAKLADGDRMALLSDTFALVQAGRLPLDRYFDLLGALPRVQDSSRTMLWGVARTQLEFLDTTMIGTPAQQQVRAVGRRLLGPQLARLGWTPTPREDAQTGELRARLIEALAKFDDAPTVTHALRAFDDDDSGKKTLPVSIRSAVIVATGIHADRARFDRLMTRFKAAKAEEDRWMYAKALASGRDPKRAEEVLAASLRDVAPANIATSLPGLVARSSPFGEQAYNYTLSNIKPLAELAGPWGRPYLLPGAASAFNTPDRASRLIEDQRRELGADGDAPAAQEAEAIKLRSAVKAREAGGLEKALPG